MRIICIDNLSISVRCKKKGFLKEIVVDAWAPNEMLKVKQQESTRHMGMFYPPSGRRRSWGEQSRKENNHGGRTKCKNCSSLPSRDTPSLSIVSNRAHVNGQGGYAFLGVPYGEERRVRGRLATRRWEDTLET